jgi:hypothetical protein
LRDFTTVVSRFRSLTEAHLVICGDLVHGPAIAPEHWPEYLGSYYRDQTRDLLAEAWHLQRQYPGRVHYLLGNHEHGHLGGPRLDKLHPDEAAHLESQYGPGEFEPVRRWMSTWSLAAVAPGAGIVFTHAAPHAQIADAADLEAVALDGYRDTPLSEMAAAGPLGALLWARSTTPERAHAFLRAMDPSARVSVFGHDPIREGYYVEHEPLLCVSTSFGCHDGDKLYLEWDLAVPAVSAQHLARSGLRRLYPDAPARYSTA